MQKIFDKYLNQIENIISNSFKSVNCQDPIETPKISKDMTNNNNLQLEKTKVKEKVSLQSD